MTTPSSMPNERDEEERKPPKEKPDQHWRKTRTRTLTANWIRP